MINLSIAVSDDLQWQTLDSGTTASFRGLSIVNDKVTWASGTNGTYVKTIDGGNNWLVGSVPDAGELDFRDVEAFSQDVAYLLSIGNGESSRIYKTVDGGKTWKLQFKNTNPKMFFDALAFWDAEHGIAMSDSVDGHFVVITTDDGGAHWTPLKNPPAAKEGEGAFAASGTCITVQGKSDVWIATSHFARVLYSSNRGKTWNAYETPIRNGDASMGVFSIAFRDKSNGIIVGGDYQNPKDSQSNSALTADGGKTWKLIEGAKPEGFRSAVAYLPETNRIITVGTSGSDYSPDGGKTWRAINTENYNSVAVTRNGLVFAVGSKGRIARLQLKRR